MRRTAICVFSVVPVLACPAPPGGDGTTGTTGTTEEEEGEATETGGLPEFCTDPPAPLAPGNDRDLTELEHVDAENVIDIDTEFCPNVAGMTAGTFPVQVYYRTTEADLGTPPFAWPSGEFPLVIFQHGNGQVDLNYKIFRELTERGIVVVAPVGPITVGDPLERTAPMLCAAEALLTGAQSLPGVEAPVLSGVYAFSGHSTGGFGAFEAAAETVRDGLIPAADLRGSVSIAPNCIDPDDSLHDDIVLEADGNVAAFVVQGSGDGDTIGCAVSQYDRVVPTETSGVVSGMARRGMVWAYDVEHNAFGGRSSDGCLPTLKGEALASEYVVEPLVQALYRTSDSTFGAAQSPAIPASLDVAAFWQPFSSEPQVFGTYEPGVSAGPRSARMYVDRFQNGDPDESDDGQSVTRSSIGMISEGPMNLAPSLPEYETEHVDSSLRISWEDQGQLSWALSPDQTEFLSGGTAVVFRFGVAGNPTDFPNCLGNDGVVPQLSLELQSSIAPAAVVDLSPYFRAAAPDSRLENECLPPQQMEGCRSWDHMQTTVRVPLADFCDDPAFRLSDVESLTLKFSGAGGELVLDDLAIDRLSGEPAVDCRCPPIPQ